MPASCTAFAGGGLSIDGTRWVSCRPGFFLPVRVLSRLFRRRFLEALHEAFDAGTLRFGSALEVLRDRTAFLRHLAPARFAEWVVYAKPPFAGPQQVLDYVARYTHRVAISNARLLDIEGGQVRFRYKNYRECRSAHHVESPDRSSDRRRARRRRSLVGIRC